MKELYSFRRIVYQCAWMFFFVSFGSFASCTLSDPEGFAFYYSVLFCFALFSLTYCITEVIIRILRREKRREKKQASSEKKTTPAS